MEAVPLSYLPRYDAEPKETKLALLRKFMAEEPLAFFKELRAHRPSAGSAGVHPGRAV